MNIAVVQGRVKGDLDRRRSGDGQVLIGFDVAVARQEGAAERVPVTWVGAEHQAPNVDDGAMVTIVGSVHRRFYRVGGKTKSRTDVRAQRVVRGAGSRAAKAVASAFSEFQAL